MEGLISILMAFFTVHSPLQYHASESETWKCGKLKWTRPPVVSDGKFKGGPSALCSFTGTGHQGFSGLNSYFIEKAEKSKEVHSGPKSETYKKLESVFYEVTQEMEFGEDKVQARGDIHIATDLEKRLNSDAFSKSIKGTGNAAYLKKFDIELQVDVTDKEHQYDLKIDLYVEVKKPSLIPSSIFKAELIKQIEAMAPDVEKGIIEEIQPQI